jgi:hypothetical protein
MSTVIVAAVAAVTGYMMGRHSDKANVAPPQKTVAASPPVAVNSKAKPKDTGEKPDLALKSVGEKSADAPTQTKPEVPPVVLLNPGTADPKGDMRNPTPTRETRSAPVRTSGDDTPSTDVRNNRPRDERAAGPRSSARDYRELREYMLGR